MNSSAASLISRPALLGVLALWMALLSPAVFAQGDPTNKIEIRTNMLEPYLLTNLYYGTNLYIPFTNFSTYTNFSYSTNKVVITNVSWAGSTNLLTNMVLSTNIFMTGTNYGTPYYPVPPKKHWWERFWDWLGRW
jgi:hypothetical protein